MAAQPSPVEVKASIESCFRGERLQSLIKNTPANFNDDEALKEAFVTKCMDESFCKMKVNERIEMKPCAHLSNIFETIKNSGVPEGLFTREDAHRLCRGLVEL
ncbi:MAG: hypothetical protein EOP09_04610 [Proteobacteria bacterium]|nr:MAG: hypothetical protein EOP09_04610 [Pseudomonadota bacterium]